LVNANANLVENYWADFLSVVQIKSIYQEKGYIAERFGDNPVLADELVGLIKDGIKTATCSALWEWEANDEPIPNVGYITIVLNGQDQPICIVETTEVIVQPFDQVDAQFALEEGEGDRSLAYWRDAHWRYFSRVLAKIGKQPELKMPVVCERFRVIYPL